VVVGLTVLKAVAITVVLATALPVEKSIAGVNDGLGVALSPTCTGGSDNVVAILFPYAIDLGAAKAAIELRCEYRIVKVKLCRPFGCLSCVIYRFLV
jgi:hypothetical protein